MTDYDSPWKEALDFYFPAFLALFFPRIYAEIDWSRGFEPLDKEFQQLVHESEQGRRYVDKLVKVWARDGTETWLLIHIEVQTTQDPLFPRRMYVYNWRIDDRYNREVVSLAVLADDDPNWRPTSYRSERWGCRKEFEFVPVKLLDYAGREAELEASTNPFARVLLAHLKVLETRGRDVDRQAWKIRLVRGLYERGFKPDDVRQLFRLIDWLMELPPALAGSFWDEVKKIQEERKMPFITTPERIGMEKGMREGMEKGMREGRREALVRGIELLLRAKFGEEGTGLLEEIRSHSQEDKLEAILQAVGTAASLEEAKRAWTT